MSINSKTSEVKQHAEFGGSQAERILNCPASVILSRGIPNKSNVAADGGTAAHACLEFIINNRKGLKKVATRKKILAQAKRGKTVIDDEDGSPKRTVRWDDDMIAHALHALTYIESIVAPDGDVFVETRLDTSKFTTKGQFSTLDVSIANWSARNLIIIDYKYGKHPVEVKKNSQLIYYALGMLIKIKGWKKFDRITCVIIQPNAHHKEGTIREWVISVPSAINWGKRFRKVVKVALKPKAPFKFGDKWCFFCPAKKKCPVMKQKQAAKDFTEV